MASRELSNNKDAEPGLLNNSRGHQAASPQLPVPSPLAAPAPPSPNNAHPMEEVLRRQPRVILTRLALPSPLAAPAPPAPRTAHPMAEVLRRQPQVILTRLALPRALAAPAPRTAHPMAELQRRQPRLILPRLALPPGCISCRLAHQHPGHSTEPAKRPVPPLLRAGRLVEEAPHKQPHVLLRRLALPAACISCRLAHQHHGDSTAPPTSPTPACTTTRGQSTAHRQHAASIPGTHRKLPRCHRAPRHKRRR
ncbi:gametogenetin-like [Lagopus muta]|uniref:gametogenetin-like n=1 Tax=Lagopus muta TaxID=64668 RepID=UPI00209CF9EF|nr:gametogenetin-like [Lagopus muta]